MIISLIVQYNIVEFCLYTKRSSVYKVPKTGWFGMHRSDDIHIQCTSLISRAFVYFPAKSSSYLNVNIFGTMHAKPTSLWNLINTLDRFVYRQNSTLLYCTIKEIIILKIACFGVIYVPFSRVITRYNVYFFTRVDA